MAASSRSRITGRRVRRLLSVSYTHLDVYKRQCMGKYYGATVGSDITRRCVQLFGGYGYMREYHVERMMRDAKIVEIYEGTSEIQKMVIAGHLKVGK